MFLLNFSVTISRKILQREWK